MKVIQNFSSSKHITELPVFDIMVWMLGLNCLKQLGYTTKLYCEERNIDWLKRWGLFELYDEIDTTTLPSFDFSDVQQDKFWSIRKLYCINHEMSITAPNDFFYIDTDIVLFSPLVLAHPKTHQPCDLFVWSPDPFEPGGIYCDLHFLSTPPGYTMPDWFLNSDKAFNCGILYFHTLENWQLYFQAYRDFVINNPCTFVNVGAAHPDCEETLRNTWACNAEQRLLAGLAAKNQWVVAAMMGEHGDGRCAYGIHYYVYRALWRKQARGDFKENPEADKLLTELFCEQVDSCYKSLTPKQQKLFADLPWLQRILNGDRTIQYQ